MGKYLKVVSIILLVINVLAIDVFLYLFWDKKSTENIAINNECSPACNTIIDEKIKNIPTPIIPTVSTISANNLIPTTKIIVRNSVQKTKSTQYIPIPGTGSTLENKWVDLSGTEFYISTDDYSGLIGAYFEANMKLINGNGAGYLRLFDVTAGVEVWGSEVSTNSQSFTSVGSGKLTLRNGNHLYRVQAKSLTADTTVFNSGKIKIITEN